VTKPIVYQLDVDSSEVRVSVETRRSLRARACSRNNCAASNAPPWARTATEFARSMSPAGRRSMLGLARICYQAGMSVTATVIGADVCVVAGTRR
jgi:hypothetical protein